MDKAVYSIVVPVYNEELVIKESYIRLSNVMDKTKENYEIIFVNDGSSDKSKEQLQRICEVDKNVKLIDFSRNFGHQAAITAGMELSSGEAVVVIDADLQDPPEVILQMIEKWKEGYYVVYGRRTKREGETFFKKVTSKMYYRLLKSMSDIDIPVDTGDFRLIDRKVCNQLMALPEKNRYVRGLISWIGYEQTYVEFIREERFAGETKYSMKKMIKLAMDGITSFSYKPFKVMEYSGAVMTMIGFVMLLIQIIKNMINTISIFTMNVGISFNFLMFAIIILNLGIFGQYVGRITDEVKNRPTYIIEDVVNFNKEMKKNEEN